MAERRGRERKGERETKRMKDMIKGDKLTIGKRGRKKKQRKLIYNLLLFHFY
jgi:hypothetical protein